VRILLTLDRDTTKREENDYVRSLMEAGFERGEIEIAEPGTVPEGRFDGLVLGGGCDVDPRRYGETTRADAGVELDEGRDTTDFALFQKASEAGVPILGICRGLQVINVARGGTLVQDIPSERPASLTHQKPPRQKTRLDHDVEVRPGTRLAGIAGRPAIAVNSRHHQAIGEPAPGLQLSANAPDGLIEGIESAESEGWLVAVQWHPENLAGDPVSRNLFGEFARAVKQGRREGISGRAGLLTPA
jgi:putative glutamine amidotransferase